MDLLLDTATNDIKVDAGEVTWVTAKDAIRQHLLVRLQTFAGEWFLDTSVGVPYFADVFKKNPDLTVLNSTFTKAILDTPGVDRLNELDFDLQSNRQLQVNFQVETSDGVLDFSDFVGV